ncbi:YncE family protein [Acidisoma silvae]|uniref:YncE family protein n=2 Tax=Acidisoma silvae TaxID=2802396 RepID=A0A963YUA9_9PROT|nr:YncE family protein [Acidisoma silvae]
MGLALAGATAPLWPDLAQADAMNPLAIIMNSGEASVSVIDMTTRKVVRTVPTLREPSHWALSPDRSKLYIADASGNALFVMDPVTGTGLGHMVMADPYQIGYTPDKRYFVVNALRLDFVDVYDGATLKLVKRFKVGGMPSHLDFSPDSRWSFNSMQEPGTLVSLDLTTMTVRWKSHVGSTPAGVMWYKDHVYCCVMGENYVAEVDPVSGKVLRKIPTGGIGPHNIFLTPDRQTIYVSNRVGGSLTALDPATMAIRRVYPFHAAGPDDIAVDPQGKLWVALRFHEKVAVLEPVSGDYETIDVGRSPHGIFLNTMMSRPGIVTAEKL